MSKVSIYENGWLDLVFEGRNKEYGAYQLRQQNPRTTIIALFTGMLFITALVSIPMIISYFSSKSGVEITAPEFSVPIELTDLPNQPKEPEQQVAPIVKEPETEIKENVPLKDPVIVKPIDATENIAKNTDTTTPKSDNPTGTFGTNTTPNTVTGNVVNPVSKDLGNTIVTTIALDKLPEFPGGMERFYNYIGNNFEKPEIEKNISVYVSFVIEKDGSMTDIHVKRDPGYGLGKEAIRVLKSLKTKWKPGMIDGKAVRTAYNLPITVKTE